MSAAPHIMLVTGEASGDALGAQLMAAIRARAPQARFSGSGGEAMAAEGFETLFPISDTSVMGLQEVVPKIPVVLKRIAQMTEHAAAARPDVVVLIDSPDFTHRIAKRLARRAPDLKVVKYVAPQVWASKPGRARTLAHKVDLVMTLLPFEPALFERQGLPARFVGHPVVERAAHMTGGAAFRAKAGIKPDAPVLGILPGSRAMEVRALLQIFRTATQHLIETSPGLTCVLPAVSHLEPMIREQTKDWPAPLVLVGAEDKFAAFDAMNAALAVSGTVSTELALARVPMVIAYKVGWITEQIARRMLLTPFITLINLISGRCVIPEYMQDAVTPEVLAEEAALLLTRPESAARQQAAIDDALKAMGLGGPAPSQRAAEVVLAMAQGREARSPWKGKPLSARKHEPALQAVR